MKKREMFSQKSRKVIQNALNKSIPPGAGIGSYF